MALAPVHRLSKKEIVWLSQHRCKHRHTYLDHYSCYLEEVKPKERIGYLDIECSNLNADYGIIFSYCIKPRGDDNILYRVITKGELKKCLDREVVKSLINDISQFDRIVTFYGTKFDIPFCRTKAVYHGLDFPEYGQLMHTDLYYTMKHKFKLSSNRLENSCRVLLGKTQKTRLDPIHWIKALQGDEESLEYILEHNKYDVIDLELLHDKIEGFRRPVSNSA